MHTKFAMERLKQIIIHTHKYMNIYKLLIYTYIHDMYMYINIYYNSVKYV